ncbi:g10812 [Coccomyxa elongata]
MFEPPQQKISDKTDKFKTFSLMESEPSGGLPLDLPLDLWQRIFASLSTEEWAMASGTCRAFRDIELGVLDMDVSSHDALR